MADWTVRDSSEREGGRTGGGGFEEGGELEKRGDGKGGYSVASQRGMIEDAWV